ncbi:MAG: hypothetical protein IPJ00_12940 [Saprospirales bacterium]|nr:hypothetical protein [Saprospirales bacterium]
MKTKYLGEELQKVDYYYDAAGKLIAINSPGEMECFGEDVCCTLQAVGSIDDPADTIYSVGCRCLEESKSTENISNLDPSSIWRTRRNHPIRPTA